MDDFHSTHPSSRLARQNLAVLALNRLNDGDVTLLLLN